MQQANTPFGVDTREIVAIKQIEAKTGINPIYVKDIDYYIFLKMQNNLKEMVIDEAKQVIEHYKPYIGNDTDGYHLNPIINAFYTEAQMAIADCSNQILTNKGLQDIIELVGMNNIGTGTAPEVQADMLKEDTKGKINFKTQVDKMLGLNK